MPSTTENLKKVLIETSFTEEQALVVKKYLEASELFESLVASGLATKRGNNLLPPDKARHFSTIPNQ